MTPVLIAVDVDGVTSPIGGPTGWRDDVTAGNSFGPVLVSPSLVRHLDAWVGLESVTAAWLTDWSEPARSRLDPFPGRDWPDVPRVAGPTVGADRRVWWKLRALERYLEVVTAQPDPPRDLVWIDDDLGHGARTAACRRRLDRFGVELMLVSPRRTEGLSPLDVLQIGEWLKVRVASPERHRIDEPWQTTPTAPCGCGWDGLHCPHCLVVAAPSGDAWSPAHTVSCHRRDRAGQRG